MLAGEGERGVLPPQRGQAGRRRGVAGVGGDQLDQGLLGRQPLAADHGRVHPARQLAGALPAGLRQQRRSVGIVRQIADDRQQEVDGRRRVAGSEGGGAAQVGSLSRRQRAGERGPAIVASRYVPAAAKASSAFS